MKKSLEKAYEITNARIQFVSLVDKAANKRQFLVKKADDGKASFATCGRIVKKDTDNHYVTGVVYEPLTEDTQNNYMTEEEITKAAYWFAKNGNKIDLQHNFEPLGTAAVVENWVAKADFDIDGQPVKKGSWLMTVEVGDADVWSKIEKGEISGFSMGGVGDYSEEDVKLDSVNKAQDSTGKKGLLKQLAEALGLNVVEKTDFTIEGQQPVAKAGKKMSGKNKDTLAGIYESLGTFLKEFDDDPESNPHSEAGGEANGEQQENNTKNSKEETPVTKQEIEQIVTDAIAKAMGGAQTAQEGAGQVEKGEGESNTATTEITEEAVEQMVEKAIEKALKPKEEPVRAEQLQTMIEKAVNKAVEPVLKSKGLPSNLNSSSGTVTKTEEHYLHGIL